MSSATPRKEGSPPNLSGPLKSNRPLQYTYTALIGLSGSLFLYMVGAPAGWLLGAILACLAASLLGARLSTPNCLRPGVAIVLGVTIGSSFTPSVVEHSFAWLPSIALVPPTTVAIVMIGSLYFRQIGRFSWTAAAFSSFPGGLSQIFLLLHGQEHVSRIVSLSHTSRILSSLLVLSVSLHLSGSWAPTQYNLTMPAVDPSLFSFNWKLIVIGIAGWAIAEALKIPAAAMLGPLALSIAGHVTGLLSGPPGPGIVILAQVAFGTVVGARFSGAPIRDVARALTYSGVYFSIVSALLYWFAFHVSMKTELPLELILLAYSPAGAASSSFLAMSMNESPAFVATHHLVRLSSVILFAIGLRIFMTQRI